MSDASRAASGRHGSTDRARGPGAFVRRHGLIGSETTSIHVTSPLATTPAHDNHVPADLDARLTGLLENLVARRDVHHANLAIASGTGERRWSAASGPTETDDPPLRPDTPFFIASVTKRFIITLVLQARERGELALAAPIDGYLPAEEIAGLHVLGGIDRTSEITVRHLAKGGGWQESEQAPGDGGGRSCP